MRFGPFELDRQTRVLTRNGEPVSLTPKAADLLCVLVENAGKLVAKEALIAQVWPSTFVEEGNVSKGVFLLRQTLGSDPSGRPYIETVPKRGYRFVAPQTNVPARPSIAVLPFVDISPDGDQVYFCDGIAEAILNRLARTPGLHVAARTSSFRYRNSNADVKQMGAALGVGWIVEGSVRKADCRVRINAQLIDTGTGFHLWSDHYDHRAQDILAIQDDVSTAIVNAVFNVL